MAFSAEANAVANFVIAVILLKGGFVPVAQNLVSAHLLQIDKLVLSVVHIIEFIGHIGNVIFAFLSEHLSACVLFAVKYDVGYGVFRDGVARNVGQLSLEALTILGTENGWSKVQIDGVTGYVKAEYISDIPVQETYGEMSVFTDTTSVVGAAGTNNFSSIQSMIMRLTNDQRAAYGLPALSYDYGLQATADTRAAEQPLSFSHTRPNGSDWSTAYPANAYYFSGENLASCDGILTDESFASSCIKWWMESESHKANILNPNYTVMAVGVAITQNGMYAVQEFATPY